MSKFYGSIGYAQTSETSPGIWEEIITERKACGDVLKNTRRYADGDAFNGEITLRNRISILADPYTRENFHSIRYVHWMGTDWVVTDAEVQYPRLILSIGGIYNGPRPPDSAA